MVLAGGVELGVNEFQKVKLNGIVFYVNDNSALVAKSVPVIAASRNCCQKMTEKILIVQPNTSSLSSYKHERR